VAADSLWVFSFTEERKREEEERRRRSASEAVAQEEDPLALSLVVFQAFRLLPRLLSVVDCFHRLKSLFTVGSSCPAGGGDDDSADDDEDRLPSPPSVVGPRGVDDSADDVSLLSGCVSSALLPFFLLGVIGVPAVT
jgi:hypothetical protein